MWELNYKESCAPKNWCFWTVVLEKTLENPLDCKEILPVPPKGDQSWVFIGRTDVEAETQPDAKSWLIGKDPDAGGRRRGRQRMRLLDGQWTWVWVNSRGWWWTGRPGVLWYRVHKELDVTERLNWTELNMVLIELTVYGGKQNQTRTENPSKNSHGDNTGHPKGGCFLEAVLLRKV